MFPTPISLASEKSLMPSSLPRGGDFKALVAVLDPDVVLRANVGTLLAGTSREVRGAQAVAEQALTFSRFAPFARTALINGTVGVSCLSVDGRFRLWASRSRAGRSLRSTSSLTPRACTSSI